MIKVGPDVLDLEFAVVIICVMANGYFLIQSGVKVSQDPSTVFGSVIQHAYHEAKVDQRDHADDAPPSLGWCKEVHALWPEVREGAEEQGARVDRLPPIRSLTDIINKVNNEIFQLT